jgi:hypothetical protein
MTREEKYFTLDVISEIIQKKHKVDSSYMFQNTRLRDVSDLRKVFFYMAKEFTKLSLQCIGDYSKYRGRGKSHNHATVLYNANAVKDWMSIDTAYKHYIDDLANEIKFYVDYEQYQLDECNKYKKQIVSHIYKDDNLDFLIKYAEIAQKLYENKDLIGNLADTINELVINKLSDEGIHQTTQEDSRLGMVQGL